MFTSNERKKKTSMLATTFELVKRLYLTKTKTELKKISSLSRSALDALLKKIQDNEDLDFKELYSKARRKKKNKESLHSQIRSVMGEDNSLTPTGCLDKIDQGISVSQLCIEFKEAGLTRKIIKKRAKVILTETNKTARHLFCATVLGRKARNIMFLDESGFNLHTSINYGHSVVNQDALLYQPTSRGQNISLCGLISINGVEHFKILDGAYNRTEFMCFLVECSQNRIFRNNPIIVWIM
ncbi:hypothetical protein CDIK_3720 [Cucumispora dikerogammari]|nr:hypothetical protein CDIK_3720 [Cucumispora dikerogammari]